MTKKTIQPSKRLSIREIARIANVSATTVSFVLNGRAKEYNITEATCERVLQAVRNNNYKQNFHGRALMARKTYLIGVLVHALTNSFWNQIIAGINEKLTAAGFYMMLAGLGSRQKDTGEALKTMSRMGVDGFITAIDFSSYDVDNMTLPDYWYNKKLVNVLHPLPGIPSVSTDHGAGMTMIGEELWRLGHRQIAFFGPIGPNPNSRFNENWRHISKFFQLRNCDVKAIEDIEEMMARYREFTAVVCQRDKNAILLLQKCSETGIRVPEDISIVGYGGIDGELASLINPELSSVIECKKELGMVAAERLLAMVNEQPDPYKELHTYLLPHFAPGTSIKDIADD
ncbi:MAG: LacI family transcriptional regulator [Oligosphaeraceae bacterium]|nr:LacI family transcriptional regulator [Oligosphaeraceae bacterium]